MNIFDFCSAPLRLLAGAFQHFVSDGFCENNNHFGVSDLILEVCRTLSENLALAPVFFAYFFVLAVHTIMTADYNYIQVVSSPRCFLHVLFTSDIKSNISPLIAAEIIISVN